MVFRKHPKAPAPAPADRPADSAWAPGDPIPSAEAREGGESVWALWSEVNRQHDAAFAETQPATRPPAADPGFAATAPMGLPAVLDTVPPSQPPARAPSLESLLVLARRNNRICPRPPRWEALWTLLGGRDAAGLPVPPVDARVWPLTPPLQKRLVLREQLEWAQRQGELGAVAAFLQGLDEADWLHIGED